jgi:hypothetical protein
LRDSSAPKRNAWRAVADRLEIATDSIDITPKHAVSLAGWEGRTEPFSAVADPLEIGAILLRQGRASALIVAIDVLYVGARFELAMRRQLERAGLGDCVVLAAASHTHFAPSCDAGKPALGDCDERFCADVEEKAVELVDRLVGGLGGRARIRYVPGRGEHSVNRRRPVWKLRGGLPRRSVQMRANPHGPNDQSLHLLRFDDADGSPRAFVWSYACHPVASPEGLHVTAEFPGVVRRSLRERFGAHVSVLFLQGFSGDLRPPAFIPPGRHPGRRLGALVQGPALGRFSDQGYERWSGSLAQLVVGLASSADLVEITPALRHRTSSLPLSALIDGEVGQRQLTITQLELSDDLQLFAVSAEVVVEYAGHLSRLFPDVRTIPVGCVGDVYGYLPTARMLQEGGYEAGEFFEAFSLSGRFRSSVEDRVLELMRGFVAE